VGVPARPVPAGQNSFLLRIGLEEVTPAVWRRIMVPGSVRVARLHDMFQAAMGWTNSHLHSFTIGGQRYGMHFDDWPAGEIDEKDVTVLQALRGQGRFEYQYDFGDSWSHVVVVEGVTVSRLGLKFAVCLDGQNACPPEDCGGSHGYAHMLEVLADPHHEDYRDILEWMGGSFEPGAFDLAATNAALQRVR
jgi:hypothetical protein